MVANACQPPPGWHPQLSKGTRHLLAVKGDNQPRALTPRARRDLPPASLRGGLPEGPKPERGRQGGAGEATSSSLQRVTSRYAGQGQGEAKGWGHPASLALGWGRACRG